MDISADSILYSLDQLYNVFGYPTDDNELAFVLGVSKIVAKFEIYDQFWVAREIARATQKEPGGIMHSAKGMELAKRIVERLLQDEGCAECFPYETINELKEAFWLSE